MAIGTAAAIAAGVGAVGSIAGASATKKAASKTADTSLAVARENNRLAADIYGQNKNALSPYMDRGNAAGSAINALLGLGATPQTSDYAAYVQANPDILAEWQNNANDDGFASMADFGRFHYDRFGQGEGRTLPGSGATGTQAAQNAFANYRDSTGYQFRLTEGMNALNSGYAAKGLLNSGAAQKAALQYGQNLGSAEFGNYLGYLGNQQGVGLSGASALAGVGQNYVNTVSANNNNAGTAAANAALVKGTANANMWGGIANSLGDLFGSSFK